MNIDIKVPTLPESVADAAVAKWYKNVGDSINRDENLMDLETDKVMLEVAAPESGVVDKILVREGAVVTTGTLLATINTEETFAPKNHSASSVSVLTEGKTKKIAETDLELSPAVRRLVNEHNLSVNQIRGTGKNNRITKQDVEDFIKIVQQKKSIKTTTASTQEYMNTSRAERRVPMSRLRARIAERLVTVQNEAAILTTFNEVNMKSIIDLRNYYKKQFEQAHDVRLGFMSFFTKASIYALKRFPAINASIDGSDIIYHNYFDMGIAIGSPRGLVVPILRNAENLSMAAIEKFIKNYAKKAQDGELTMAEMKGGTFTITNGGTYGSMLSTPIINPPQTAILGMHNIVERPVVIEGEIMIRPMMYLALSYDHRIIDGAEAVQFLVMVKEMLESPTRMLLEI